MSRIYFHIPYCKQACRYCNFHFSLVSTSADAMVDAMIMELETRSNYIAGPLKSIYFGGGTPSLIAPSLLGRLIENVEKRYQIAEDAEITLEANPDDINTQNLRAWKAMGINRLSIGVQSFNDKVLAWTGRKHSGMDAIRAIADARIEGFDNLSIDLIYGMPKVLGRAFQSELDVASGLQTPHISTYALTVEPHTQLGNEVASGSLQVATDDEVAQDFQTLTEWATTQGYIHYELSNFAKPGMQAKHNSAYWNNEPYLGIGPSAHSFDGDNRGWNLRGNSAYIRAIHEGGDYHTLERLSPRDKYNEYIMTQIRLLEGISAQAVEEKFGKEAKEHFLAQILKYTSTGVANFEGGNFILQGSNRLLSDGIASHLFM